MISFPMTWQGRSDQYVVEDHYVRELNQSLKFIACTKCGCHIGNRMAHDKSPCWSE